MITSLELEESNNFIRYQVCAVILPADSEDIDSTVNPLVNPDNLTIGVMAR
jgi:hypothetical protein